MRFNVQVFIPALVLLFCASNACLAQSAEQPATPVFGQSAQHSKHDESIAPVIQALANSVVPTACSDTPTLYCNTTRSASLGGCFSTPYYIDLYLISGTAGQTVTINGSTTTGYQILVTVQDYTTGTVLASNYGVTAHTVYTFPTTETYVIGVVFVAQYATGPYTLQLTCNTPNTYAVVDHGMAKGVDQTTSQPVGVTSTFSSTDAAAYQWTKLDPFSGSHQIQFRFFAPDGSLYYADNPTTFTGDGGTWYFWEYIYIAGYAAASKPGQWRAESLVDGVVAATDTFTISSAAVCLPSATSACMLNNRFQVSVSYRSAFDNNPVDTDALLKPVTGFASTSYETAFFYFNSSNNIEMLVKILDQGNTDSQGRATIAVLIGTATPLRIQVTITDTKTGAVKQYSSAFGSMQGITDFTAFLK